MFYVSILFYLFPNILFICGFSADIICSINLMYLAVDYKLFVLKYHLVRIIYLYHHKNRRTTALFLLPQEISDPGPMLNTLH